MDATHQECKDVGFALIRVVKVLGRNPPELTHVGEKMASGPGSVASLWTEVNRCGQNGDFTRALKAVNKSDYLESFVSQLSHRHLASWQLLACAKLM